MTGKQEVALVTDRRRSASERPKTWRAAKFFLLPDNGFVTGQVLYVCGGITLRRYR